MKQGNPQKKMGRIAMLTALISGMLGAKKESYGDNHHTPLSLMKEKSMLLTNGGRAPIPSRLLNQKQKRKRFRQANTCR